MLNLGDITKINGAEHPIPSVVIGGSPCQDLSVAGKRAGLAGERSGLFMEQIRIIKEMRSCGRTDDDGHILPRWMVWENVPGALSSQGGEDFRAVLEETCRVADETAVIPEPPKGKWTAAGAVVGDGYSVAWRIHDAQYWGVPQRRRRIALVADFGGGDAAKVLFESAGVSGDTEQGGETRQGAAGDAPEGIGTTSKCLNGWDVQSKHIQPADGIAEALYAGECRYAGGESYVFQKAVSFQERAGKPGGVKGYSSSASASEPCQPSTTKPCYPIEGNGARPSHQGDGWSEEDVSYTLNSVEHHAVAYGICSYDSNSMKSDNPHSGIYEAETSRTLDNNGGNPACNQGGIAVYAVENHPADSRVKISDDGMVQTLSSRMGTGGGNTPLVVLNDQGGEQMHISYDKTSTLRANANSHEPIVMSAGFCPEVSAKARGIGYEEERAPSLRAGVVPATHAWDGTDVSPTLTARNAGGGQRMPDKNNFTAVLDDKLTHQDIQETVAGNVVRRLTPRECERLQGFPDDYTDIGEWIDSRGRTRTCADSLRYKALGNSIALPFWQFLLKRIAAECKEKTMVSLFDGIGGFPLCWQRAGGETLWVSEIEEFCIAVTKKRFEEETA